MSLLLCRARRFIMIGIIHAYFSINLNVVWSTLTEDIPLLITGLKGLLGED